MHRIRFLALKELHHVLRDPRSLAIALAMPIMMTFLYGYAINLDIENVVVGFVDYDRTPESRDLIGNLYASTYFSAPENDLDHTDPETLFRRGRANAVLVIEPGFGRALNRGEHVSLGLLIDGSDNNVAAAVKAYTQSQVLLYYQEQLPPGSEIPGIRVAQQVLYNPDLKSSHFFVPGLVAIILMMISALLTSITIAREKETGTMEQLLTAPVKPLEILLGKIIPYVLIALLDGVVVLLFAKFMFGVPFVGSHLLLLGLGLIYVSASLAIGILISSLVHTQQVAMMTAITATMLPSVMLSGFIFAVKNTPLVLQALSQIVPATYFLVIIRGIMLKGAGPTVLAAQAGVLVLIMVITIAVATSRFRTKLG